MITIYIFNYILISLINKHRKTNNKFVLDNNDLLRSNIMNNSYEIKSSEYEFYLNFNPTFPLMYYIHNTSKNIVIIGKELYKVKLVKGINNRGIIYHIDIYQNMAVLKNMLQIFL